RIPLRRPIDFRLRGTAHTRARPSCPASRRRRRSCAPRPRPASKSPGKGSEGARMIHYRSRTGIGACLTMKRMLRPNLRALVVALPFLCALYLFGLTNVGLVGPDEPRYAA